MILAALSDIGGKKYLVKLASENSTAFSMLLGKVLPLQVTGEDGGPIVVNLVKYNADDDNSP